MIFIKFPEPVAKFPDVYFYPFLFLIFHLLRILYKIHFAFKEEYKPENRKFCNEFSTINATIEKNMITNAERVHQYYPISDTCFIKEYFYLHYYFYYYIYARLGVMNRL